MSLGYVWVIGGTWGFKRECDSRCSMPIFLPLCGLQRGSNALLIYHSSAVTVWSSPDDPHLVPHVFLYSLSPWVWILFLLFLSLLLSFFLFLCRLISVSDSLSFLAKSAFIFTSLPLFTLTSIHLSQSYRMLFSIFQQQCLWTSFPCLSLSSLF